MRVGVLADAAVVTSGPAVDWGAGARDAHASRRVCSVGAGQCVRQTAEVRRCVEAIGVGVTARVPRRRGPHRGWSVVARWTTHRARVKRHPAARPNWLIHVVVPTASTTPRAATVAGRLRQQSTVFPALLPVPDGPLHVSAHNTTPSCCVQAFLDTKLMLPPADHVADVAEPGIPANPEIRQRDIDRRAGPGPVMHIERRQRRIRTGGCRPTPSPPAQWRAVRSATLTPARGCGATASG